MDARSLGWIGAQVGDYDKSEAMAVDAPRDAEVPHRRKRPRESGAASGAALTPLPVSTPVVAAVRTELAAAAVFWTIAAADPASAGARPQWRARLFVVGGEIDPLRRDRS